MPLSYDTINSPVGKLTIIASPTTLQSIIWDNLTTPKELTRNTNHPIIAETKKQLTDYFNNQRQQFDLPLAPIGTPFQQQVWKELLKIPYGETISYGEQAKRLGDKNKARAVGSANGKNPIPIIIPCHRVIGSNGKLTGFAGGLDKKSILLTHERR